MSSPTATRSWTALASLCLIWLAACRLVSAAIVIPIAVTALVCAGVANLFVGSESAAVEDELYASGLRIERRALEVEIAENSTFEGTLVEVTRVTGAGGLELAQQRSLSYDPSFQELELVSAWVEHADGTRIDVDREHVFERPSAVDRGTPGFIGGVTKTVLFPQLTVGSRIGVEWRFAESAPSTLGFHYAWRPPFALDVDEATFRIVNHSPNRMAVSVGGEYELSRRSNSERVITEASLRDYKGKSPEPAMVSPRDVCPSFMVSSTETWEEVGEAFGAAAASSVESTSEILALADEIVDDREGIDAARAIHRWVCTNIHYVPVYLHPMDGWTPHPASEVLANRYGDCKDKYAVTASLLAAKGIRSEPVLIKQDRGFMPFGSPTPLQFDHCMLYLPDLDVFSNPTDPLLDLGELDNALSGKFILIAGEDSRVSRTPPGSADDNKYSARHRVKIDADGWMHGESVIEFEGRTEGRIRRRLVQSDGRLDGGAGLLRTDVLGGFGEFETTEPTDLDTPLRCEGRWTSDIPIPMGPSIHFAMPSGIDFANAPFLREFISSGERRYPALVAATDIRWHLELEAPEGFEFVDLPADRTMETKVGKFDSRHELDDSGRLVVERVLRIEQDLVQPDEYPELRRLLLAAVADMGSILSARERDQ